MVRVGLMLATVATLLVGCASLTPGNVPSIPPINLPSIPPLSLPSGLQIPPGILPSGNTSGAACQLATAAEVSQIMGSQVSTGDSSDTNSCSYVLANFSSISIEISSDTDLTGARFLMGTTAKDINVGGLPGISGSVLGQGAVYVQKGGTQLQILGILTGTDDTTMAKLLQIATVAASRLP